MFVAPESDDPAINAKLFAGIDVGTSSVRVGLFDEKGRLIRRASHPIRIWHTHSSQNSSARIEQSTDDIWDAVCVAMRIVVSGTDANQSSMEGNCSGPIDPGMIAAIGFCATCSMAVVDEAGQPLPVGVALDENNEQCDPIRNVIVWIDQRAGKQAERINKLSESATSVSEVLQSLGARISPEMQIPKLLWLRENASKTYHSAEKFFDLADYLTWRANGSSFDEKRSVCTTTCKWTFQNGPKISSENALKGWNLDFFRAIGLLNPDDTIEEIDRFLNRIGGSRVGQIGSANGAGLCEYAASQMDGLTIGIPIATGLIDAHSGALGSLKMTIEAKTANFHYKNESERSENIDQNFILRPEQQLALIAGTSACTMYLTKRHSNCINGIWGPYYGVVWPMYYLYEGGMSAFGSALEFGLKLHPAYSMFAQKCMLEDNEMEFANNLKSNREKNICFDRVYERLENILVSGKRTSVNDYWQLLVNAPHVVPEFLGNRSPDADPNSSGLIAGLRMDAWDFENESNTAVIDESIANWFIALICALCYGVREIIETLEMGTNERIDVIIVSGGMSRSPLFLRILADATNRCVSLPGSSETMLLGAAISAAVAANHFCSIHEASTAMVAHPSHIIKPMDPIVANGKATATDDYDRGTSDTESIMKLHQRRYSAYCKLKECARALREH